MRYSDQLARLGRRRVSSRASILALLFTSFVLPSAVFAAPAEEASAEAAPTMTKPPALLEAAPVDYPPSARQAEVGATVIVRITITATGEVSDPEIVQSGGEAHPFDAALLAAIVKFRFSPAEFDGSPGPVRLPFRYDFEPGGAAPAEEMTRPPERLDDLEPTYPESARESGESAEVELLLEVDAEGRVGAVAVQRSSGSTYPFDEAAIAAARQFRFRPAEFGGQPGAARVLYSYRFTLRTERVEVPVESELGEVSGLLLERGSGDPLIGLDVRLVNRDLETESDTEGRFSFEGVAAGSVDIEIDDTAYYTLADREEVVAGERLQLRYYLEPKVGGDPNSIRVTGRRPNKEVTRRTLSVEEIRKIPGTQGDALKVVQNLPGVARIPFGGGGLIVRGSNPGDSGAMINRHFIPIIFHFGGIRSIFPSELLESIDFYPGNFSSEFGRFSGGIVDARFRRPKSDRLHGRFEADVFDTGILVEGPVSDNATFALAGRRSYIDAILPAVIPDGASVSLAVAPRYYDYQALYDWKKGRHRLRLYAFGSSDALKLVLTEPGNDDAAIQGAITNNTSLIRGYAAWDFRISNRIRHHLSVASGQNSIAFSLGEDLYFRNNVNLVTIRDNLEVRFSDRLKLRTGFDGEAFLGQIALRLPQPQKEGSARGTSLGQLELKEINRSIRFYNPALWAELQWQATDRLQLIPGVRVDYDEYLDDFAPDPRLNFFLTLVPKRTTLKGGIGRYSQRPAPDETDATFGNPALDLEHSMHSSLGVEHRFTDYLQVDFVGFYKHLYGQVSPIPSDAANASERYDNNGEGRIYGAELLVKHDFDGRLFAWISYTLMRSERKDSGSEDFRLFSFDQTHILTVIGQYKLTSRWEVGLRWRYTTGNPRTPYTGKIYDSDSNTYVALPGEVNSARNAAFQQVDLRVDRRWLFNEWTLTLYFEVQNLLNQTNQEGVDYNYDFSQQRIVGGLPIIPSLGIRGEL